MPIVVSAKNDDRNDDIIRKFKKKVIQNQILTELKKREFYKKPSQVKKEKRKELLHKKKLVDKYGIK